jgi:hypothetical protein
VSIGNVEDVLLRWPEMMSAKSRNDSTIQGAGEAVRWVHSPFGLGVAPGFAGRDSVNVLIASYQYRA